jgi:signal transduction protein with GAF and PtsI domain
MFPMIATLEDLREARAVAERVREEVGAPPVAIGMMVKVPSTVIMAREFAQEADFFSIGTKRSDPVRAADRPAASHPGQVRGWPAPGGSAHDRPDDTGGRCDWEMGGGLRWHRGRPARAVILAGLGVTELSVSIPCVAAVNRVRSVQGCRLAR